MPTDVRPVISQASAQLYNLEIQHPTFELESASGEVVELTRTDGFVHDLELVPTAALAPNTRYTLRVSLKSMAGESLVLTSSFTTGAGPLATPAGDATASLAHYSASGSSSTCSPPASGSCLTLPSDEVHALTFLDEFGQEQGHDWSADGSRPIAYLQRDPMLINLSGLNQGTNFVCAKVRTRAANGTLGAPRVLCGADAPTYNVATSDGVECRASGLVFEGQPVSPSGTSTSDASAPAPTPTLAGDGSCAIGGSTPRSNAEGLAAVVLGVIAGVSRRRRRR